MTASQYPPLTFCGEGHPHEPHDWPSWLEPGVIHTCHGWSPPQPCPARYGIAPLALSCSKLQGHSGPHTGSATWTDYLTDQDRANLTISQNATIDYLRAALPLMRDGVAQ